VALAESGDIDALYQFAVGALHALLEGFGLDGEIDLHLIGRNFLKFAAHES